MKRICIALDYTPSAAKVAEIGYLYAKTLSAQTTLVHVIADPAFYGAAYSPIMGYTGSLGTLSVQLMANIKKEAKNFLSTSVRHLGDKAIKTKVLDGDTADAILEFAAQWSADLIVLGTHSHSGFENLLMGNTALKIVKHSKIPLLIIPTKKESEP